MIRTQTRPVMVGNVQIGGQNKVVLQSMTNTFTRNVEATIQQCLKLEEVGCQIIRFAIPTLEDAQAIQQIKPNIHMPIVSDIHFDYRLALAAIEAGTDAVRINPGNIGAKERVVKVVRACQDKHIPIRIGINSGSLKKEIYERYGGVTPQGMIDSAKEEVQILEELGFEDIVLSFKSSDVMKTIEVYRLAAKEFPYPLHLGVTEAGSKFYSSIKSSSALGAILMDQIGDTIRISVSGDPLEEIQIGKHLLKQFHLMDNVPEIISCPTCGRTEYDMFSVLKEIEDYLSSKSIPIKVAIMGCIVNGPGEAKEADLGIAGGKNEAILFRKGEVIRKLEQNAIISTLKEEIEKWEKDHA